MLRSAAARPRNLLLDTGILGQLCHPRPEQNQPVSDWLARVMKQGADKTAVYVPEIADYELRRKLLHMLGTGQTSRRSIDRLDDLAKLLDYLPLDTETMRRAAELWAEARAQGLPTAGEQSLDGDVILAARALTVDGTIVTTNRKHLSRFVPAKDWTEIPVTPPKKRGKR